MKKNISIVAVIASPKPQGNTAALVREALKSAGREGASVREILLLEHKIEFCRGCLDCMKTGRCHIGDDFAKVKEALIEADGIIWASPVYAGAPTAVMKCLIDRLGMLEVSTSMMGGKYMAGISTANSASAAKKTAKQLARFGAGGTFLRSFASGHLGAGTSGGRLASQNTAALNAAAALGRKLAEDIKRGKGYPLQSIPGRIIGRLIMKPAFSKYIVANKDADARALYDSLKARGLLA